MEFRKIWKKIVIIFGKITNDVVDKIESILY